MQKYILRVSRRQTLLPEVTLAERCIDCQVSYRESIQQRFLMLKSFTRHFTRIYKTFKNRTNSMKTFTHLSFVVISVSRKTWLIFHANSNECLHYSVFLYFAGEFFQIYRLRKWNIYYPQFYSNFRF